MQREKLQSIRKEPQSKVTWAWGLAASGMAQRDEGGTEDRLSCRRDVSCGGGFQASTGGPLAGRWHLRWPSEVGLAVRIPPRVCWAAAGEQTDTRTTGVPWTFSAACQQCRELKPVFSNTVNKKEQPLSLVEEYAQLRLVPKEDSGKVLELDGVLVAHRECIKCHRFARLKCLFYFM